MTLGTEWPEHPWNAVEVDGHWAVKALPPNPWPEPFFDYGSSALFGPTGTVWSFDYGDLLQREFGGISKPAQLLIERWLQEQCKITPPRGMAAWLTPAPGTPLPDVRSNAMRWAHVTIIGTLGTVETVAHTFNFRSNPADLDRTEADLTALATLCRDRWVAFLNADAAGLPVKGAMAPDLTYTEVRAAYLEQTAAATFTTHPGKRGLVKDFHYPRPAYLVPTQYSLFAANVKGAGAMSLPWEVALAASFTTGLRGSRNRGRVYLGPMDRSLINAGGVFNAATVDAIGAALGTQFVNNINANSTWRHHIVSRTYATSVGVNGVSMGHVPDSQRRRRRSQPETAAKVWTG